MGHRCSRMLVMHQDRSIAIRGGVVVPIDRLISVQATHDPISQSLRRLTQLITPPERLNINRLLTEFDNSIHPRQGIALDGQIGPTAT